MATSRSSFLFLTASHVSLVHIRESLLDFCFLHRTMSFEVLSESTDRQQSPGSSASFDVDPLGLDQKPGL